MSVPPKISRGQGVLRRKPIEQIDDTESGGKLTRSLGLWQLTAIGVETSAEAVGKHYGSRQTSDDGLLDGWLVADGDQVSVPGVAVRAVPLLMSDVAATAAMARAALELSGVDVD